MVLWRSWLARFPVTEEVAGSSPVRIAIPNAICFPVYAGLSPLVSEREETEDGLLLGTAARA